MRLALWTVPFVCVSVISPAWGQDGQHLAEHAPLPLIPPQHTLERAGHPDTVGRWAIPALTSHETGGYVGGGSLRGNNFFGRGLGATTGAPNVGTFGTDFVGFRFRPGRVFLAPSVDTYARGAQAQNYRSESNYPLPDVVHFRPLRKAILARNEDIEKRHGGGEHGGSGGHGGGGGEPGAGGSGDH